MHDKADPLIGLFYEAAIEPALWSKALAAFADSVRASDAHIIVLEKTGRPMLAVTGTRGILRDFNVPYFRSWACRDPLIPKMISSPQKPGTLMLLQEYLSPREVLHSDYFQDFAIPHGVRHQAAWVLEDNSQVHAVVDFVHDAKPFEREQLSHWNTTAEHLRRALRMGLRLAETTARATQWRLAIERAHLMCLLADSCGRILDQSASAADLINSGGALRLQGGRLATSTLRDTQRLRLQIALSAKGRGGGELRIECKIGTLHLQVLPAGVGAGNPFAPRHSDCALILIEKRTRGCPPAAADIRTHLNCTMAEAQVAAALAAGQSPQEIAAQRQVSIHTVRTQVRALFARTATHRIGELVGFIARL